MAGDITTDTVSTASEAALVGVIVHLSGPRRGKSVPLSRTTLRFVADAHGGVRILSPDDVEEATILATLHPLEESYEIVGEEEGTLWVNGQRTRNRKLETGDVIEFGDGVAVVRFRLYPRDVNLHKSVAQAFSDCIECVKHDHRPAIGRTGGFFVDVVRDLATQTSVVFRVAVVIALVALGTYAVLNVQYTKDLEQRLADEEVRVKDLHELLERAEEQTPTREELAALQEEIQRGITLTEERVEQLEARSAAARRAIAQTAQAVVFVQGSFGFDDAETGRPLRLKVTEAGNPIRLPSGRPAITLEGDGPPVEIIYTGTAFIISDDGLLLTNRHIAMPWENEDIYKELIEKLNLVPVTRRFLGYLTGDSEAFDIEVVRASDDADVALLRCETIAAHRAPLTLRAKAPQPGDEVIVLGYPTGIRALLARAGEKFVKALTGEGKQPDAWEIAQAVADAGLMAPLASRGIVGQVTTDAIVYDAETTQGGSGGPVVMLNGEVVAINAAVFREFGGANLGVPVHFATELLNAD